RLGQPRGSGQVGYRRGSTCRCAEAGHQFGRRGQAGDAGREIRRIFRWSERRLHGQPVPALGDRRGNKTEEPADVAWCPRGRTGRSGRSRTRVSPTERASARRRYRYRRSPAAGAAASHRILLRYPCRRKGARREQGAGAVSRFAWRDTGDPKEWDGTRLIGELLGIYETPNQLQRTRSGAPLTRAAELRRYAA